MIEESLSLFGDIEVIKHDHLEEYLLKSSNFEKRLNIIGGTMFGDKNKLMLYKEFPVDIFYADDKNWIMQKFIRTGGKDNNALCATVAKRNGYKLEYYNGCITDLKTNEKYYPKDEEDIFNFLGLEYRSPIDRT